MIEKFRITEYDIWRLPMNMWHNQKLNKTYGSPDYLKFQNPSGERESSQLAVRCGISEFALLV